MSNDARFWAARFVLLAFLLLETYFLTRVMEKGMAGESPTLWATLFFIGIVLALPAGFYYQRLKDKRWVDMRKPQDRIEVETLAEYVKQKRNKQL